MNIKKELQGDIVISNTLYVLRALAIVCVAAAHCESFQFELAEKIRSLIGTMGVPCFLLCSGYFFSSTQVTKVFWTKKLKSIVIPWVVWGILTFAVIVVLGGRSLSIVEAIRWIVGYNTWLYFVPVLLCCFALFRISVKRGWLILNAGLFVCSWLLSYINVFKTNELFTLYQIPFNYTGFFLLGYLLKGYDLKKLLSVSRLIKACVCVGFLFISVLYGIYGKSISYWGSLFSIPFELTACVVMFWLAASLNEFCLLSDIGKRSFFIYFVHMEIGSGIAKAVLFRWLPKNLAIIDYLMVIIKPIIIVAITYLIYICIKKLFQLFRLEKLSWIISV